MNNNYFTLNNIQYVIVYKDFQIEILRKKDDNFVLPDENEIKEIESILNKESGYTYNRTKLNEVLNSNNQLENKEYLYNFLQWLENGISINCRNNLYHNLKTLQVELNLNMDNFRTDGSIRKKHESGGAYNVQTNQIEMSQKSILETWKIAEKTSNPNEFFWKLYNLTLLHELTHMASSQYNPKTGVALVGFDKFPPEIESDRNRGLTEGFTEVIAMAGVPGTIEIASGYYIEASLVNQLIQIIGVDVLLESYFSNLGIAPLEKKLNQIIDNPNQTFGLFRNIEWNYLIVDLEGKQNILGNIQSTLLDYLDKKLEKLSESNSLTEIENILNIYKEMMITPEKLQLMQKNPENYVGITENIEKFKILHAKYTELLTDSNEHHSSKAS